MVSIKLVAAALSALASMASASHDIHKRQGYGSHGYNLNVTSAHPHHSPPPYGTGVSVPYHHGQNQTVTLPKETAPHYPPPETEYVTITYTLGNGHEYVRTITKTAEHPVSTKDAGVEHPKDTKDEKYPVSTKTAADEAPGTYYSTIPIEGAETTTVVAFVPYPTSSSGRSTSTTTTTLRITIPYESQKTDAPIPAYPTGKGNTVTLTTTTTTVVVVTSTLCAAKEPTYVNPVEHAPAYSAVAPYGNYTVETSIIKDGKTTTMTLYTTSTTSVVVGPTGTGAPIYS